MPGTRICMPGHTYSHVTTLSMPTDLQSPPVMLKNFADELDYTLPENRWKEKFRYVLDLNIPFFKEIINKGRYEFLVHVFRHFYSVLQNKKYREFVSSGHVQARRENIFIRDELRYLEEFELLHKRYFDYLLIRKRRNKKKPPAAEKTNINTQPEEDEKEVLKKMFTNENRKRWYWELFLHHTTFFCAAYHLRFVYNENPEQTVEDIDHELPGEKSTEYYLFYNRSNSREIGVGTVEIKFDGRVELAYYYDPLSRTNQNPYRAFGKCNFYDDPSILIVNTPGKKIPFSDWYNGEEFFFSLKKYEDPEEKVLLGVSSTWNRKHGFPYSTAVVLIETSYYYTQFTEESPSYFPTIRDRKRGWAIPSQVYYFLYHQAISLKNVLPILGINQLPYTNEVQHLKSVAGVYCGHTVICTDKDGDYLQIARLEIKEDGVVFLKVNKEEDQTPDKDTGFIKFIDIDKGYKGKMYINLRYDYPGHFNSFTLFLDFQKIDRSAPLNKRKKMVLRGSYAGDSDIAHRLVSSTVIFEEVDRDDSIDIRRIPIVEEGNFNPEIKRYIQQNRVLYQFFIEDGYTGYSNDKGILLLKESLSKSGQPLIDLPINQQPVFISIALTHNNNNQEAYEKNCRIALELREELTRRYGFQRENIYCGCFRPDNNNCYDLLDYKRKMEEPDTILHYIRKKIESSKSCFFIYPRSIIKSVDDVRISSSLTEVGFALGRRIKTVIIIDKDEVKRMPANLLKLNPNIAPFFSFNSGLPESIKTFFETDTNEQDIADYLRIKG